MTKDRIDIGIDVGWSAQSRSCGVAVRGIAPGWEGRHVTHYGDVSVKLFRLHDLVEWLPEFIAGIAEALPRTTLVVDGPLGTGGPPQVNRYIDSACRIQGFHRRTFPNDVTGTSGQQYVDATYRIIRPFLQANALPWLGERQREDLTVAETHPAVGLALQLPQLDPQTLPSRRKPFILSREGDRLVRAKSDWYWMRGAGREIARQLDAPVSQEMHHERRAALYCLAVAQALSSDTAFVIGRAAIRHDINDTGVYALPARVHADWTADINRIGVVYGEPQYQQAMELVDVTFRRPGDDRDEGNAPHIPPTAEDGPDGGDVPYGQQILYLCDFGGVWERHNPWMEDCDSRVELKACDGTEEVIAFVRAQGSGQWKAPLGSATIRELARSRGFAGQHLSHAECRG